MVEHCPTILASERERKKQQKTKQKQTNKQKTHTHHHMNTCFVWYLLRSMQLHADLRNFISSLQVNERNHDRDQL